MPHGLPDMSQLKSLEMVCIWGLLRKNRFEPSFALGLALRKDEVVQSIEIDIEQFKVYTSGNIIALTTNYEKWMVSNSYKW